MKQYLIINTKTSEVERFDLLDQASEECETRNQDNKEIQFVLYVQTGRLIRRV